MNLTTEKMTSRSCNQRESYQRQSEYRRTSVLRSGSSLFFLLMIAALFFVSPAEAQTDESPGGTPPISRPVPTGESSPAGGTDEASQKGLSLLSLLFKGGWFMLPLLALSVLMVIITVERLIALRADKTLPPDLVKSLGDLSSKSEGFDPRAAYKVCQNNPSVAATVVQSMLLKVGRPIGEVETTVQDTSQREADRLQRPIRWLELSAAIAPLIGLLGTVWGVTQAFYEMTQLTAGQNKAETLASGIYTALVTTISGLIIAIPALVMFKGLESQIEKLFHRIDEMMLNLIPQIERFEGQIRFSEPSQSPTSGSENSSRSKKSRKETPPVPELTMRED